MAKKEEKTCCADGKCDVVKTGFKVPEEIGPVTGCKPCASQVLLELLTVQEMMGTKLVLNNNATSHAEYQAYVIAIGPALDPRLYGFQIGDRVLLSGSGTPVPNYDHSERERILMEPYSIKAVLT